MRASAKQLAREIRQKKKKLTNELRRANKASEWAIWNKAVHLSEGSVRTAELSRPILSGGWGHPYGFGPVGAAGPRGPVPYGTAGIINQQTGRFKASWETSGTSNESIARILLWNYSPEAKFMLGTSLMVERPILAAVVKAEYPAFLSRYQQALRRGTT